MEDDFDTIVFGGRPIRLASPGSQELILTGVATEILAWEPKDKGAHEIEVRARIVDVLNPEPESAPEVRWFIEVGHGSDVWREPPLSKTLQQLTMQDFTLPGRGMIWRVATRFFRIGFHNAGPTAGPGRTFKVQVTFLPVWGEHSGVRPYVYRAPVNGVTDQHAFPIAAREFQIVDPATSRPPGPGVATITFVGITGDVSALIDVDDYSDFRAIPHEAAGFLIADAEMVVVYR